MSSRSDEVLKQLNRLVNDRKIAPQARNQIREAVNHIRDLQCQVSGPGKTPIDIVPD
ncbi:MAG: hypothetical protein ACI9JR_000400 [Gammaproteobacteria bacterium]|jgi:hypothetical protein